MNATTAKGTTTPRVVTLSSPTLTGGHGRSDAQRLLAPGHLLATDLRWRPFSDDGQVASDTQASPAVVGSSHQPPLTFRGEPMTDLNDLATDPKQYDTQAANVGGDPSAGGHSQPDTQGHPAPGTISDDGQVQCDTHMNAAVVGSSSTHPTIPDATPSRPSSDGWLELRIWAEMFEDAQKSRIASVNRAERGGVDPHVYEAYTDALTAAEKTCGLHMRRCFRRVVPAPIVEWQKATNGIGEHLLARLLGHLGHPVWATPHHWEGTGANRVLITDPPFARTVGQLWQYCGHGAPGRIKKGATFEELAALGSPNLKMIVHLCAEACMKTRTSPYRLVYETARLGVTDKTHTVECVRCGPSGKPAQVGSPWSAGHQHAHALRIVGKELLRDLWIVAGGAA